MGSTLRLIRGARLITDLESRTVGTDVPRAAKKWEEDRVSRSLEELSQKYGLASRQMALVAVVQREGDQSGQLPETRVAPVGMPQDVSFESYFGQSRALGSAGAFLSVKSPPHASMDLCSEFASSPTGLKRLKGAYMRLFEAARDIHPLQERDTKEDLLLELASKIEPDGGMPGESDEQRVLATLITLLFFASEGHTPQVGAFRTHVQRLVAFLQTDTGKLLSSSKETTVKRVCEMISGDRMLPGDWSARAQELLKGQVPDFALWKEIDEAIERA